MSRRGLLALALVVMSVGFVLATGFLPGRRALARAPHAEPVSIAVVTSVFPSIAWAGMAVRQTAVVTNVGHQTITDVQVRLELDPGCTVVIAELEPGRAEPVMCRGVAPPETTSLRAWVSARLITGESSTANATVRILIQGTPPTSRPSPLPDPGSVPSTEPLAPIPSTGNVPAPTTQPTVQPTPEPTVQPLPEPATPAPAAPVVPAPVPAAPAAPAARAAAPIGAPEPTRSARAAPRQPPSSPAVTAMLIAALGVFVMTVSVGALAAARIGK